MASLFYVQKLPEAGAKRYARLWEVLVLVGVDRSTSWSCALTATAPLRLADSDEDDDIPRPEPLPQEWLADSQEHMSITYNTDREGKSLFILFVIYIIRLLDYFFG